jgi:tetratricopeptide (TPR) repeat protein
MRALLLSVLLGLTIAPLTAQQADRDVLYQEARRLFDALDYERAVVALDQAIAALQAGPADATRNDRLTGAFEMRARSKFGLGDQDGARADFVSLLKLAPGHTLSGQVSPRVVALFEETARDSVTNLTVSLTPATAKLQMDGVPLSGAGTIRVAVGEHVLSAEQPGYRSATQTVVVVAGTPAEVALTLERVSSVVRISTTPADIEVKLDGKVIGKTAAEAEGTSAGAATLVVSDVESGTHTIELTGECFVPVTQRVEVARPDDYTVGPVALQRAVATLKINANQSGARVFLDGADRGVAPVTIADVCQGEHLVELRNAFGSDVKRVPVKAGDDVAIDSVLKPSYAIVSSSGGSGAGQQDVRVIVERAFAASRTLTFVAPPTADADKVLGENQLTGDWLAVDPSGRPVGAGAQIAGPLRKEVSAKLADAFHTQGVASVTMTDGSHAVLALLNAGSTMPDVIEVTLDNPQSITAAVARLDRAHDFVGTSLGVQAIDVADVGVVVVGVDPAAGAQMPRVGDVIVQADGKPAADVAALMALADSRRPGESLTLDLRDAGGAPKRFDVKVVPAARAIGLSEHGLLVNRLLLSLRPRLAEAADPFEQAVLRLNIAIALARLSDWGAAREGLLQVKLAEGSGVGNGTVQYLLGLAAENLGNRSEAEAAFKNAAASDSLLTENGPPVRELAESRLMELQKVTK